MNAARVFATAICVILIAVASCHRVLGQTAPTGDLSVAGHNEDSRPLIDESTVGPSEAASYRDLTFGQSSCARWTASADFITMERVGGASYSLVSVVPHNENPLKKAGTEVLDATDLHQGFSGGPQLGLTHHGDDGNDLEVLYFQIDGWDSAKSVGPVLAPNGHDHEWLVMRAPGNFVQFQNDRDTQSMTWDYSSRFYNAEVNMRRSPWRRVTLLAGFRWVNLSEDLEGILLPPTQHGTGSFWYNQTKNNLYGFQIGMDAKLLERNRFSIGSVLKAGIFDDHVEESAEVRMDRIQSTESGSTNHLAFLGQLGVQCKFQATPRLLLKAGYEAIWLEGVALAPGQIAETYCYSPGALDPWGNYVQALGINCSSGVFYHGATAGLEYSF